MDLIERYLQAVGRELPAGQREDILTELRSSLYDELERAEGSDEEAALKAIRALGPPQAVAAAYYPAGQYLIGPVLYPMFLQVLKIVFASVIGVQLLLVVLAIGDGWPTAIDEVWGIAGSLPSAFGMVVAIFWLLQRGNVQPAAAADFDPRALPPLEIDPKPIDRIGHLIGMVFKIAALVLLARFAERGSIADNSGPIFENAILASYAPWAMMAIIADIALDVAVFWRGRWQTATRVARIAVNLFILGVLFVMIREHDAVLGAAGQPGLFRSIVDFNGLFSSDVPLGSLMFTRLLLASIAIVTAIDCLTTLYRLLRVRGRRGGAGGELAAINR